MFQSQQGMMGASHARPSIEITKLLISETGTYNPQYRRPYNTQLDGATANMFQERLGNSRVITSSQVAGIANQFLAPAATPEKKIEIPGDWGERRMRFIMEVTYRFPTGGQTVENVLGYTNFNGISRSGAVAEDMVFVVNSVVTVRQTMENTVLGAQSYTSVVDSSHILADSQFQGAYSQERDQRMRPMDVYATMMTTHLPDLSDTLDLRTTVTTQATKSRRSNNLPAAYVANVLQNYKSSAMDSSQTGQGEIEILSHAQGFAAEEPVARDPFLKAISGLHNTAISNTFTISDLRALSPNVDAVTLVTLLGPTEQSTVHQAGQTAEWGASNRETVLATSLSNAVPTLLMELGLTKVAFMSTNRDIGGQIQTRILDAKSFSNTDQSQQLEMFRRRLEHEVLWDLSFSNEVDFAVQMNVDLLGETWIQLSYDGGPFQDYVTPSFCDALLVPVVTSNAGVALNVAQDFQSLTGLLVDGGTNGMSSIGGTAGGSFNF